MNKFNSYTLGVGYVGMDGKRGKYTIGPFDSISLHGEMEGRQNVYNQICLQIPDGIDKHKKYSCLRRVDALLEWPW